MVDDTHIAIFIAASVLYTIATIILIGLFYNVVRHLLSKPAENYSTRTTDNSSTTNIKKKTKGYKIMIGCNACGLFSFTLHGFVSTIILWIVVFSSSYNNTSYMSIFATIWGFYLIGVWTMLFIFVSRIDHTFSDSFLAYPPLIIKILYAWIYILAVLGLIAVIFNILALHSHLNEWLGPLILILHFLFSITLMYLLSKKVFQSFQLRMIQRIENENNKNKNNQQQQDNNKNVVDLTSIKSWTRYAMLVMIGIISTYIANVIILCLPLPKENTFHGEYSIFYAFDITINALALYFLFAFNGRRYYKMCGVCHVLCEKCCIECAFRCIDKDKISDKTKEQCANLILSA